MAGCCSVQHFQKSDAANSEVAMVALAAVLHVCAYMQALPELSG